MEGCIGTRTLSAAHSQQQLSEEDMQNKRGSFQRVLPEFSRSPPAADAAGAGVSPLCLVFSLHFQTPSPPGLSLPPPPPPPPPFSLSLSVSVLCPSLVIVDVCQRAATEFPSLMQMPVEPPDLLVNCRPREVFQNTLYKARDSNERSCRGETVSPLLHPSHSCRSPRLCR